MNRGKLVIVLIFVVALAAAGFGVWYRYLGQHRSGDFWGTRTALLIVEAPQVQVLRLGGEDVSAGPEDAPEPAATDAPASQAVEFGERTWQVMSAKEARLARGIKNIRSALVQDTTFDWKSKPPDAADGEWQYALVFNDERNQATVLFDFKARRVALGGGKKVVLLDPEANKELHEFFDEQFAEQADQPAPPENTAAPEAESVKDVPPTTEPQGEPQPPPADAKR